MTIRQYTKKGDPILSIKLSSGLIAALKQEAKENQRPYQDELALRLYATFKRNAKYQACVSRVRDQMKGDSDLMVYRQQISQDMMNLLIRAADIDHQSIEEEVSFRLKISFMEALAMGTSQLYTKIVRYKLTQKDQEAQRAAMRLEKRYGFELEQLALNIRYAAWIPKEMLFNSFERIDVAEQSAQIRELIAEERQAILEEDRGYGIL